ncbi:MAG TPA: hypothetical protein VEZ48_14810 [Sphingomonadaceae bacterium]|nr:hypothetical protein [Sphingomonadaceae bacterium]
MPASAQQTETSLAKACPKLTSKEIWGIENYKGEFAENALYARAYCLSVEEAERRMAIQLRDAIGPNTDVGPTPVLREDSIGAINAALQEKEAVTFAGLWIEHRPSYRVVAAFTRNAAATLAEYTKDPLFKPLDRPGPTYAELRATQDRLTKELSARGYRWSSASGRENMGIVQIQLAQEAAPIRAAAARGEFSLPSWVVLIEPKPLPIAAPPAPPAGDMRVKSFPRLAYRTDMYMRTLVGVPDVPAALRLVGGCLVLATGTDTRTALWQASDALDLSDPARVIVVYRLSGTRVAAGDAIVLSGLQPSEEQVPKDLVGTDGCPGPYRVVRGFGPREAWEVQRREGGLSRRLNEPGTSRAAATADYLADQARLPALQTWQQRMLSDQADVVAAIWIDDDNGTAHLFHTAAKQREQLVPAGLLPFVTAPLVPLGSRALEEARDSPGRRLAAASVEAKLEVSPIEGVVHLRPADPRALSVAAVAGRIDFPAVTRIGFEGTMPLTDERERMGRMARSPEAMWLRLEAALDFAAIRKLVEATPLPVVEPHAPPTRPSRTRGGAPMPPTVRIARPSRAASLSSAHFLVAFGQTAKEITALKARGFDPVDALDAMNGRPTDVTRALLARQVIVAELVALNTRDAATDGYRSTARWRVVETLKGAARPGDILRVRMISGEDSTGASAQSNEEPVVLPGLPGSLERGGRWLLHLNDAL